MKKINIKKTSLLSVLVLGLAIPSFAQAIPDATSAQAAADLGPGLIGTNYSEVSFGYQKQVDSAKSLRDYEFVTNANVFTQGIVGMDANFTYDYLSGDGYGYSDHRNEAQFGLTGFLLQSWGKPFVTADGGYAWQVAGGSSRKSYAYTFTGGTEFQVLKDLVLTPFIQYQAAPHLYDNAWPRGFTPDHGFDYGVKATYRITRQWDVSLSGDIDQHSTNDYGLKVGVSYRF